MPAEQASRAAPNEHDQEGWDEFVHSPFRYANGAHARDRVRLRNCRHCFRPTAFGVVSGHLRASRLRGHRGSFVSRRERSSHEKNDDRHGGESNRRRRCRFRGDDGAASSGRDRHGCCRASPRPQPADQAVGAGDHRDPAAGDCRHAPRRRSAAAAVPTFAGAGAIIAADRFEIRSTHRSSYGAV